MYVEMFVEPYNVQGEYVCVRTWKHYRSSRCGGEGLMCAYVEASGDPPDVWRGGVLIRILS